LCRKIDSVGGYFMLSNSDTDFVKQLYKGFTMEDVMASRNVSCKSDQRGRQNELLIRNYD
jgi:DNA adenine methylase